MKIDIFQFFEVANSVIEILIFAVFLPRIFQPKQTEKLPYLIGYAIAMIIQSVTSLLVPQPYIRIAVTFVLLISLCYLLYKGSAVYKIFATLYCIMVLFLSEAIFVGLLTLIGIGSPTSMLSAGAERTLGMLGTKLFDFWIIVYSCKIFKGKVRSLPIKHWFLIILMPIISGLLLYLVFPSDNSSSGEVLVSVFAMLGLLYFNFSVFNYFESFESQIRLAALEQIMEHEDENYRTLTESYEEIRNIKHDLKNQTSLLHDLINQEKYADAKEHISQLYKTVERATSMCCTGNPAVDSIINLKGDLARSHGISYMTKLKITELNCDTVGLCRILGNALDNAIEACVRSDSIERCVCLMLSNQNERLLICIENTSPPVDTDNLTTTKANKATHGIGLQSIRRTVSQMGGNMSCAYSDGYFTMNILI